MNKSDVEITQTNINPLLTLHHSLPLNFSTGVIVPEKLEQLLAYVDDNQVKTQLLTFLCRVPKLDVRLDFENLYIGLKRMGWAPAPKELIEIVRAIGQDLGEITKITTYADWGMLDKKNGYDIQRQLESLGYVDTRYQINIKHKNSADMRIASDIHEQLERDDYLPGTVDIFILGTGDGDFRHVVKMAKGRGKKVIILALKNSLSRLLIDVATEVRYLDDYLDLPKLYQHNQRRRSKHCLSH